MKKPMKEEAPYYEDPEQELTPNTPEETRKSQRHQEHR